MLHHIENHIEKMRQKPEHIRKQYALGVSTCIMVLIFSVWIVGKRTPDPMAAQPISPTKALTANVIGAVGGTFDAVINYGKTFFVNGNKVKYDPIEVTPGKI